MAGYNNRGMVFREVKDLLSDEEIEAIEEQERQEREGNIPKQYYLTELYREFERINSERMADETEMIGILTAMREKETREEIQTMISTQIRESIETISRQRKEILHDRQTLTELKRLSR